MEQRLCSLLSHFLPSPNMNVILRWYGDAYKMVKDNKRKKLHMQLDASHVNFTLFGSVYFCIPIIILEFCSEIFVVQSLSRV